MMAGQNPHPGDMHHGQIPVDCPTPPPPLPRLGLDIDRCITLPATVSLRIHVEFLNDERGKEKDR